jgi:paired amphipathic helix protein Sin3a
MQPEVLVYNAGVERQFFDATKEALTSFSRDGDVAWGEFLKCLDMYAQEMISKNEMLSIMEDLLGKQHRNLFEEFKRILAAAGAPGAHTQDDAWHSVPLSEIDFSRCRRCTPSYRALPRDYPCPPFSERNEEEAKVLNDVWISLPDGSEESYTFRHMRKNQHEEVLFRCEDERFEIDMVLDSNACTLQRLEPIVAEINAFQQKELSSKSAQGGTGGGKGAGGKVYKYSFDKRILNTIHKHCVRRIYGDAGADMLEKMYKYPVVTIPIVVKRLRQKDEEFRAARKVLNRRWKELAEINYYKSLDHRSLTWRAIDKRATSTRTLATDIKDRAANNGFESEVAIVARKDKAKDEHGSFYEVTMGRYLKRKMDLSHLPKPCPSIFTPHMSINFDNNSWAQRDAYRIISFALERGPTPPADKDRCHSIWRHFLSKFFGLSLMWIQAPAMEYVSSPHDPPTIVSNECDQNEDDVSSTEENEMLGADVLVTEEVMEEMKTEKTASDRKFHILDHQPIPTGSTILTVYGEGTVMKYHRSDQIYEVSLQYGAIGYLNQDAVLCSILPAKKSPLTKQLVSSTDESFLEEKDDMFVLGPQCLYLFFRLYQILIRRLNIARDLAYKVGGDKTLSTLVEEMTPDGNVDVGQKRYEAFLSQVYGLIEGSYTSSFPGSSSSATAEGGKYEDRLRCLLGHKAYELATMDKLISHILKNLQNIANDDTMQEMVHIYRRQQEHGGFKPMAFKQEAATISEGENIFAFQYCKIPNTDNTIMHMEFLGCIIDEEDREDQSMEDNEENIDMHVSKKPRRGSREKD